LGIEVSLAAVALGACIIEKHFTLDNALPGPDHLASADPDELRQLVQGIRKVEVALGNGKKRPTASEQKTALVARRSLFARGVIAAGSVIRREQVAILRPGTGLSSERLPEILGKRARREIGAGEMLSLEMFDA